jgi:hypothetical protein
MSIVIYIKQMGYKHTHWVKMAQARVQWMILVSMGSKKGSGTTTIIFNGGNAPQTTCTLFIGTFSLPRQNPMAFPNTQRTSGGAIRISASSG